MKAWLARPISTGRALLGFVIFVIVVGLAIGGYVRIQDQRRADNCRSRERLYDGEFVVIDFAARELKATPAQVAQVDSDLVKALGPRPSC